MSRIALGLFAFFMAITLVGCGGSSDQSSTASAPTPPSSPASTPTLPSSPMPPPTPAPTPTTNPAPDDFQASIWYLEGRTNAVTGMLSLNVSSNNGSGTVQISRATAVPNSNFVTYFWPFSSPSSDGQFQVGTFSTDANGSANATFQFPSKGNFAGSFHMYLQTSSGPTQYFATGPNPFDSRLTYSAPLLPASSISGGVGAPIGTASGTGKVSVTGNSAQVSLASAGAAHSFNVADCGVVMQHCVTLGTLTTDARGNASGSFSMNGTGLGGFFVLSDDAGAEYLSGFHVQ